MPDGSQLLPDGTRILPNGTKILPNGITVLPDGTRLLPNGTKIMPSGEVEYHPPPGIGHGQGACAPIIKIDNSHRINVGGNQVPNDYQRDSYSQGNNHNIEIPQQDVSTYSPYTTTPYDMFGNNCKYSTIPISSDRGDSKYNQKKNCK